MSRLSRLIRVAAVVAASGWAVVATAAAPASPERPIQIVAPFAAGSPPDLLARLLVEGKKRSGFADAVVLNQPGAGGSIGVAQVAAAVPDGYTLAMAGDAALLVNPALYPERPLLPVDGV